MNGYANRGMTFESLIEYANKRYRMDGQAIIEKQHTLCKPLRNQYGRVYSAKYEEKATVDFMGRVGDTPIAFEAKHCTKSDRIDLKRVEEHQCDFLRDWTENAGAIGFVIVSFDFLDFYLIPWDYWQAARESRKYKTKATISIPPMETPWAVTGKASIRKDEMPEEWRVTLGGTSGLDYLKTVKRLWGLEDG